MSKFKVGDKVKIIGESYGHDFAVGTIGTIVGTIGTIERMHDVYTSDCTVTGVFKCSNESGTQIIHESALKLVSTLNQNAIKWIKALRSGKFKQTKNRLRDVNGFCCLGVACEIYRKSRKKGFIKWDNNGTFSDGKQTIGNVLPKKVQKWLGLKSNCGFLNDLESYALTDRNDSGRYNFNALAHLIERNASKLFVPGKQEVVDANNS